MLNSQFRTLIKLSAVASVFLLSLSLHGQDTERRGRKYVPPPATAHVSVAVIKDTNSKPVENAAVVFHMIGDGDKGNMELKTNEEGKAIIDVIPIGDTVRLQVIANGFQTFGEDFKIDTNDKEILVRLKRPGKQYSTYEHADTADKPNPATGQPAPGAPDSSQKSGDTQTAPKQ